MRVERWMGGIALGTVAVAALFVAPALRAQETHPGHAAKRQVAVSNGQFGVFTPASADPKLAAMLARSGLPSSSFRFTPSESRDSKAPVVAIAVRAASTRVPKPVDRADPVAPAATVGLQPIAYNLGVSVAWKRLSVSGDIAHVDLVAQPGSGEHREVSLAYTGKRAGGRITAGTDTPLTSTPTPIGDAASYSIDVGGSYRLTRNLDVTAGVRYKADRDRLPQLTNQPRDSQAVYVGTAFRF